MVNYSDSLNNVYFALSSDIRRAILQLVQQGPVATSEVAHKLALSLPALHKHTKVLVDSKLIRKTKKGRVAYLVFEPGSLRSANEWIRAHEQFWDENLQNLDNYFNDKEQNDE